MKRLFWLMTLLLGAAPLAAAEELFEIKPVVEGVYAAIAKPSYPGNCNAAIILLERGVLVVDTHAKPSAARGLIQQIKKLTPLPVRYVVNTHFHYDHYQGNQAYPSAWPAGVEIISSEVTRENVERLGVPRARRAILDVPKDIERLRGDLARATDPQQKHQLEERLRQAQDYLDELKQMQFTLPSLTFDRSLILHDPKRTVEILWLGKAHTDGDVFVYLPKEKVIASGDALQAGVPYMGDGYPYDWIRTLDRAEKLDFDVAIGGHGDVMKGKGTFDLWKQYFTDLMQQTTDAYAAGASLDEAVKQVQPNLTAKYAGRFPPSFPQAVIGNIEKAYRVVSGQTR